MFFARIRVNVLLTTRQVVTAAWLPSDRAEAAAVSRALVSARHHDGAGLGTGGKQPEWQKWTDRDVLVVHKVLLGQRQILHDRVRFRDILGIE